MLYYKVLGVQRDTRANMIFFSYKYYFDTKLIVYTRHYQLYRPRKRIRPLQLRRFCVYFVRRCRFFIPIIGKWFSLFYFIVDDFIMS